MPKVDSSTSTSHSTTSAGSAVRVACRQRSPEYPSATPPRVTRSCAEPRTCPAGNSSRVRSARPNGWRYPTGSASPFTFAPSRCRMSATVGAVAMVRSCRAMWSPWACETKAQADLRWASRNRPLSATLSWPFESSIGRRLIGRLLTAPLRQGSPVHRGAPRQLGRASRARPDRPAHLSQDDPRHDERAAGPVEREERLAADEVREERGRHRFEREDERRAHGRGVALPPVHDEERERGHDEAQV